MSFELGVERSDAFQENFDAVADARGREKLGLSVQRAPFFGFLKAR